MITQWSLNSREVINSQCSSIKWIQRSTKYILPRIQVFRLLSTTETRRNRVQLTYATTSRDVTWDKEKKLGNSWPAARPIADRQRVQQLTRSASISWPAACPIADPQRVQQLTRSASPITIPETIAGQISAPVPFRSFGGEMTSFIVRVTCLFSHFRSCEDLTKWTWR